MKKNKNDGFFLSETMVVITIVAVVLLGVFKIFSSVYIKYKESENYNTINALNIVTSMDNYYKVLDINYNTVIGSNSYVDITNYDTNDTEYYTNLKETIGVNKIYLIDMSKIFTGTNISTFNVSLRKYLNTLQSKNLGIIILVVTSNNEYGYIKTSSGTNVTLVGDANDEYSVLVPIGGAFTDPGYENWSGDSPTITWETPLNVNVKGTYYLRYNFNGYLLRRKVVVGDTIYNYSYTGDVQTFTVPATGRYKLEVWGAQGGYANTTTYNGGYGGYSVGVIYLQKNNVIYVYVGGKGANGTSMSSSAVAGGFNGGGSGFGYTDKYVGGGGGATHIATKAGTLSTLSSSTSSILIVAAGGGGAVYETASAYGRYGYGGGFTGVSATGAGSYVNSTGGTQSAGGSGTYTGAFGRGATCSSNGCGGGGGGYYGGGSGKFYGGGSGGSSYIANSLLLSYSTITKSMYCYSCTTSSTSSTLTYSTTNVAAAATANYAKSDNGYAKITYLGES